MAKALVVLSGGQDSTTCLGWALQNYNQVCAITFDYNQRHNAEIAAARTVVDFFSRKTGRPIYHEIITLPPGMFAGSSPLTNKDEQLETYTDHDSMEAIIGDRIEKTFVPMRNAVFLMIAANRAAVWDCQTIVTGVCQGDNANYPDCREDFIDVAEVTINEALGTAKHSGDGRFLDGGINIATPLMHLSKADTVQMATELPYTYAALAYSHTAYDGAFPPTGNDHASLLRAHGFEQAGLPDPLILRAYTKGFLNHLPNTANYSDRLFAATLEQLADQWV